MSDMYENQIQIFLMVEKLKVYAEIATIGSTRHGFEIL